ncbi:MAG: hypothetical protein JWM55_316 [Acidimicrobiaceae bacterium]|nr:hypothetical protein [Acidimicrobiaceae bacterium]
MIRNSGQITALRRLSGRRTVRVVAAAAIIAPAITMLALASSASGSPTGPGVADLIAGNLLVSRSVYKDVSGITTSTQLPPGCAGTGCASAISNGMYPYVFNNDTVDASFGITSPIYLDQITPTGSLVNSLEVPNSLEAGVPSTKDQMVTSFSSKSEMALNLSTNGNDVTFMGYAAPVGATDVSNSNTPGVTDPTNPVSGAYYRVVGELDAQGKLHFTLTNAYSGNNGRAAILDNANGDDALFTAGNAGNGSSPQPNGIILGAGTQILTPETKAEVAQQLGAPTPVGSFNITELGKKADKIGKDDNFRGLTIFDKVLYYTKGSGSNGVNTVYFLDTTGTACPNGVGLPVPGAPLPSSQLAYDSTTLQANGLPSNMCILKGFTTTLAKTTTTSFPFGVWFANATTMYVADEGNGSTTYSPATGIYTDAAASTTSGLQKWVFNSTTQSWQLAYTLQNGLNLGSPYVVADYPTGNNPVTRLPWAPATDGLRNITGRVNADGTVTIWGITSTVSGSGDQGADPNKLMSITDSLAATSPGTESFTAVDKANFGEVLRGVSFTPGTK